MDDVEGYSLAEQWEHLAERFTPPLVDATITVTLTSAEAAMVHEAMTAAAAALVAEIEADQDAGGPPLPV